MPISNPRAREIGGFLSRWELPILAAIVLIAAGLRFYRLSEVPPGLHYDEASSGMEARRILATGQFPVFFPGNQGVDALIVYLTLAAIKLFGDTPWVVRIPVAALGTLTVLAAWWMCRELYGRRSAPPDDRPSVDEQVFGSLMGLGAALVLAFLFWHLHFSRIDMMSILVPFFLCLSFGLLALALNTGRWPFFALTGIALGASMYTYKAGYAIPPLAAVYVAYCAFTRPGFLRHHWRNLALCFGVTLLVYTPLINYGLTHPDEYFLRFRSVTVDSRFTPGGPDVLQNVPRVLGMFFIRGDVNDVYNLPGRPALDPFLAILFVVGLARAVFGWRDARLGILVIWLGVMSLPTLLTEFAPAANRAIGDAPVLVVLCVLGAVTLWELTARLKRRWAATAVPLLIAAGVVYSGAANLVDYFVNYAGLSDLYRTYDQGVMDFTYYANTLPASQTVYISPNIAEWFTIQYVRTRPIVSFEGRFGMVYPPPGQEATLVVVLRGNKPVLDALLKARPDASVVATWADPGGTNYAKAVLMPASQHPASPPDHPVGARLGDSIHLLGYSLSSSRLKPGDKLTVTLFWQADRPIPLSYTVFTHLLAANPAPGVDPLLAGHDKQPVGGSYPTDGWQPGETILDQHTITVPADAAPGTYHLNAGMYLWPNLEHVPAIDASGRAIEGGSVPLATIDIVAAQ